MQDLNEKWFCVCLWVYIHVSLFTCINVAYVCEHPLVWAWKMCAYAIILVVLTVHSVLWHFWSCYIRRPDEYTQRQSDRVGEQRWGTAAPGCQSASTTVTRLIDQRREQTTKRKRSHNCLTRSNKYSFQFSLPILPLVHLFCVDSFALSPISIKLKNTLTWLCLKMTIM